MHGDPGVSIWQTGTSALIWLTVRLGNAQGHTIGRLLLHGLHGEERERERSNLNAMAVRAERNLHTRRSQSSHSPDTAAIQFDAEALPECGAHSIARSIGGRWHIPGQWQTCHLPL